MASSDRSLLRPPCWLKGLDGWGLKETAMWQTSNKNKKGSKKTKCPANCLGLWSVPLNRFVGWHKKKKHQENNLTFFVLFFSFFWEKDNRYNLVNKPKNTCNQTSGTFPKSFVVLLQYKNDWEYNLALRKTFWQNWSLHRKEKSSCLVCLFFNQ